MSSGGAFFYLIAVLPVIAFMSMGGVDARAFFFDTSAVSNGTTLLEALLAQHAQHSLQSLGQLADLAALGANLTQAFFLG